MNIEYNFSGPFKELLPKYIEYKRSLGFTIPASSCRALRAMDDFFAKNYNISKIVLSKDMVLDFVKYRENEASATTCLRCSFVREFAKYLKLVGFKDIYVLPSQYIPKHITNFTPFIFNTQQISEIINIIDNYHFRTTFLQTHRVYATLIRLLYACGLRSGEALSLKISDIDFTNSIIHVLDSKNNTSRIVCMSNSLSKVIQSYIYDSDLQASDWLFTSPRGGHYSLDTIHDFFTSIFEKAGIFNSNGRPPRVHDLRHTFAVHSLRKMINEGMDIYCTLPFLASFLGHKNIYSTEKYLRLVEEDFSKVVNTDTDIFGGVLNE